jgi:hypothetical protein
MKPLPVLLSVMAVALVADSALAQVRWYRPPVVVGPGYSYGYGGYYGGYSPVEGYQRGMADVIRARGEAAENVSRARINNEEARSKYLDNKLKWTEIYWERKRLGEAELAKDYAKARERREYWKETTRDRTPETLHPSQFNAQTGDLEWPEALQGAIYANSRKEIEAELQLQATTGTTANAGKIRTLARQMQDELKDHIREMSSNEYIAARKFLDRLVNQMAMAQQTT